MRLPTLCLTAVVLCALPATVLEAQQAPPSAATVVPRLVRFASTFVPANGLPAAPLETVTLAIYADATGGTPLWQETQNVAVDAEGRYALLLGLTQPEGLPLDVFASGEARWLGRRFERPGEGEQARVLLASVPYALKASDADTLGGRPPSAYLLANSGDGSGMRATSVSAGATQSGAAAATASSPALSAGAATAGGANFVGKFVNTTDLGNSAIYDAGGFIGINTTTPADILHARFTNTNGTKAGFAVQNLGNTATSYSGMLFYDQNGALGQFQGFNNLTHEYRIHNVAAGGSINFMLAGASKFTVAANGNVGIGLGTTTPLYPLTVQGAAGYGIVQTQGTVAVGTYTSSGGIFPNLADGGWYGTDSAHPLYFFTANSFPKMTLDTAGNVGIGTTTPGTHAKVEIVGGTFTTITGSDGEESLNQFGLVLGGGIGHPFGTSTNYSLYTDQVIASPEYVAFSDARMKHIEGRSDPRRDLATLAGLEVTNYSYIDTATKGAGVHKKVIAQQVEQVYPQAVTRSTDVVPDIYRKAWITDGWVTLDTDLTPGERVRLIGRRTQGVYEVLEVEEGRFRTAFAAEGESVFVYGREVKDFRSVDYEAIAMLNVSATQELHRRLEQQASEIAVLREQLAALAAAVRTAGPLESTRLTAAK
jgi:Chaperone of endosialidase